MTRDVDQYRRRGARLAARPDPLRYDATKCVDCGRRRNVELLGRRRQIETSIGTLTVRVCTDPADCRAYLERGAAFRGSRT